MAHFEEGVGLALCRTGTFGEGAKLREGFFGVGLFEEDAAQVEDGFVDQG